jgi:hypothetical protein
VRRGVPYAGRDVGELVATTLRQQGVVLQERRQLAIASSSSVFSLSSSSLLNFVSRPQRHLEDVVGLHLREVEDRHAGARAPARVVAAADDRDDLVDVEDRDEQALDEVQAVAALRRRNADRRRTTSRRWST